MKLIIPNGCLAAENDDAAKKYRLLENWWSKSNNRGFRLAL